MRNELQLRHELRILARRKGIEQENAILALIEREKRAAVEEAFVLHDRLPNGGLMDEETLRSAIISEMFPQR